MVSVLQVTPALDAGGVERTTIEVAEALTQAGGRALVASRGGRLEAELSAVGGELVRLPLDTKNPLTIWRNAGALASVSAAQGVEIIHARSRAPAWSAYWAARRLRLPFVTTYHGIYNARSAFKRMYNGVMARGDLVIANSEYTKAHLIAAHGTDPARVVAIPRGVDLARFDPAAIEPARIEAVRASWFGAGAAASDDAPLTVLVPARLTAWKGQGVLIDAAARVAARRPGLARYVLAGDPQGREAYVATLRRQIEAGGLVGQVEIVGHVTDMPAAFAASDVAVFPSIEPEAFGRGAVEAQAMGLPVLVAAHGGLTETIRDGETGFHVAPGAVEAWAEALERILLLSQAERRALGAAGQRRVRALYSKTALQSATLAVYDRVLRERG